MFTESLYLAKDTGVDGDNITREGTLQLDLNVFDPSSNDIKYTLKKADAKGVFKVVGKANTVLKDADIDDAGIFTLKDAKGKALLAKDGLYSVEITQGGNTASVSFTIDTKAPANLTVSLEKDTGANAKDMITNDGTLKLAGLEKGATLEWKLSADTDWQAVDPELITSATDSKGKAFTALELLDILGDEFAGKADLVFRQVDGAGNASAKNATLSVNYDGQAPEVSSEMVVDSIQNNGTAVVVMRIVSNEQLYGLGAQDFVLSGDMLTGTNAKAASVGTIIERQDGDQWIYEVPVSAKKGNGMLELSFSPTASFGDAAGNTPDISGIESQQLWVGAALSAKLLKDSGVSNKDNVTNDGSVQITSVRPDLGVEFRLKAGSDSSAEGSEWIRIPDDYLLMAGGNAVVSLEGLGGLLAEVGIDIFDADGNKDSWEFRQVDADGNAKGTTASLNGIRYDLNNPDMSAELGTDFMLNKQTMQVRLVSTEDIPNLDAKDFLVSNNLLKINKISKAVKEAGGDGVDRWVYTLDLSSAKTGSGEVTLSLAENASATDSAGNALLFDAVSLWVGADSPTITLVQDTGAKDGVTYNGKVVLTAINEASVVEFRLKAGSESNAEGSDWLAIPTDLLPAGNAAGQVDLADLYALLVEGGFAGALDADGRKDSWEFRQVDEDGNPSRTTTPLDNITYDPTAPVIEAMMTSDFVLNGGKLLVRLVSSEPVLNLDKLDFKASNALASISNVSKGVEEVGEDGITRWVYTAEVTAAKVGSGEVELLLADKLSANDLAGNALSFEGVSLWVGADSPTVTLAHDTGAVKDLITYDGTLKVSSVRAGSKVEFRLKEGSESHAEGSDWMAAPATSLPVGAAAGEIELADLYALLVEQGLVEPLDADGRRDSWQFRQVDAEGNPSKTVADLDGITFDAIAPVFEKTVASADVIPNGEQVIISFFSPEPVSGLSKTSFKITGNPTLASVDEVKERTLIEDGKSYWVYDVKLGGKTGNGEITLAAADKFTAFDKAGNLLPFKGYSIWVGSDAPTVSLFNDTGTGKDFITNDSRINVAAVKAGATVQFRIKTDSESLPDGSEWVSIPATLLPTGSAGVVKLADLYALLGDGSLLAGMDADGWKDSWEFRQVDATGNLSKTTFSLNNITYDAVAPKILSVEAEEAIPNNTTATVRLFSSEPLSTATGFALEKNDFMLETGGAVSKLATIKEVSKGVQLPDGDGVMRWAYDVKINALAGSGEAVLKLTGYATDVAGTQLKFDPYTLWIGSDSPTVNLITDSGTSNKDLKTNDGKLQLGAFKTGATLEFQLKTGSESNPAGSDWIAVPANMMGLANTVDLSNLYQLLADAGVVGVMPADGWTDSWTFRQRDADGKVSKTTTDLDGITYDKVAPVFNQVDAPDALEYGATATIKLSSAETMVGLAKTDFALSNDKASITGFKETKTGTEWEITIKAGSGDKISSGAVSLTLAAGAATDVAGNNVVFAGHTLWVGSGLTAALDNDTGINGDKVTKDGHLTLAGIREGASIEFRIKAGSEGMPDGSDWFVMSAELLAVNGQIGKANLPVLYQFLKDHYGLGDDFNPGVAAWKDAFEFRQLVDGVQFANTADINVVYDTTIPEILDVSMPQGGEVANGGTGLVRIVSTEQLMGLDKNADFVLSDTLLTYISGIQESKLSDGSWAYDVAIKATTEGTGEVKLNFTQGAAASDLAGNALNLVAGQELGSMWIGGDNLFVRGLLNDTNASYDQLTSDGRLKLNGIIEGASLDFRLKAKSESLAQGSDWVGIPEEMLTIEGRSAYVDLGDLYTLLGTPEGDPIDGLKDIWEFRQSDAAGNISPKTASITVTYDDVAPQMFDLFMLDDIFELPKGKTGTLRLVSDEKLWGLGASDFKLSDPSLASITGIKEVVLTEDEGGGWAYDVTIKAGSKDGYLDIYPASLTDFAIDFAGNPIDLDWWANESFLLGIGSP